jgi:hypothetical protein
MGGRRRGVWRGDCGRQGPVANFGGWSKRSGRRVDASLCIAAGRPPLEIARFMGHAKVTTTLAIYTHPFDDNHAETMAALEAMSRPATPNVAPMRRLG